VQNQSSNNKFLSGKKHCHSETQARLGHPKYSILKTEYKIVRSYAVEKDLGVFPPNNPPSDNENILEVRGLNTYFNTEAGQVCIPLPRLGRILYTPPQIRWGAVY
jgi:hypothetical protein